MKIQVTKEDIRQGNTSSPSWCPVALAVRRAIPDSAPLVGNSGITFYWERQELNQDLPRSVRWFIRRFDTGPRWARGLLARPFTFELKE